MTFDVSKKITKKLYLQCINTIALGHYFILGFLLDRLLNTMMKYPHKQTSLGIIGYGWNALRIQKAETISKL